MNRLKEYEFDVCLELFLTNIYYSLPNSELLGFPFLLEIRGLTQKKISVIKSSN
jgi:inorganic triphosphatase YgiF